MFGFMGSAASPTKVSPGEKGTVPIVVPVAGSRTKTVGILFSVPMPTVSPPLAELTTDVMRRVPPELTAGKVDASPELSFANGNRAAPSLPVTYTSGSEPLGRAAAVSRLGRAFASDPARASTTVRSASVVKRARDERALRGRARSGTAHVMAKT